MATPLTDRALPETLPPWGVLVLESHHSPQFEMEWRTHGFSKIVYVLKGRGTFHLGRQPQPFSAGDVIVVAPQTPNRIVDAPSSAASLYICCVAESVFRFDPTLVGRLQTRVFRRDGHFANRVASIFRRLVHWQETGSSIRSAAMVADALKLSIAVIRRTEMARMQSPATTNDRALVQDYIDALPDQFFDETTIDAAAGQLGIARRTFTKLFVEITGESWLQYLRRLAVEHAKRRLQQSDLPIASIAFECGFNDLSTFYRQFKKQVGQSPGQYRGEKADGSFIES